MGCSKLIMMCMLCYTYESTLEATKIWSASIDKIKFNVFFILVPLRPYLLWFVFVNWQNCLKRFYLENWKALMILNKLEWVTPLSDFMSIPFFDFLPVFYFHSFIVFLAMSFFLNSWRYFSLWCIQIFQFYSIEIESSISVYVSTNFWF